MNKQNYIELVDTVKKHDYRYWTLNAPTITDEEYDVLYSQLQECEQEHPEWILPDSPTQVISTATNGNNRRLVRRRTIMLSTEKANSVEKLIKWMTKTTKAAKKLGCSNPGLFTVEWKYDGESCSLVYIDGDLVEASTGKGMDGMDALQHVRYIPTIPQHINAKGRVEVRGEVICPFSHLASTGYKTCRMAAAGYLANAVPNPKIGEHMRFMVYYVDADVELNNIKSYPGDSDPYNLWNMLYWISWVSGGEFVFDNASRVVLTIDDAAKQIEYDTRTRSILPFPTDGLVIKAYDRSRWSDFGATDHHPKYSCAYKFPGVTAVTTLRYVEITVGEKTGKRTPVAHFDPVVMNGATYKQCSCGSEATFAEKNIHPGDRIIVTLANDVICQVVGKAE